MRFIRPFGSKVPRWFSYLNKIKLKMKKILLVYSVAKLNGKTNYKTRSIKKNQRIKFSKTLTRKNFKPFQRQKNRYRNLFVAFSLFVLASITLFILLEVKLKPTIIMLASVKAKSAATEAVNRIISEEISGQIKYEDMMIWKIDKDGNVIAIQPNTSEINRVSSFTTVKIQEALNNIKNNEIAVPLGYILNNNLVASLGPMISIGTLNAGTVNTTIYDEFESVGINQVRHKIYMDIIANMNIVLPSLKESINIKTSVPIAEIIILGDVPNYYVSMDDKSYLSKEIMSLKEIAKD